MNLRKISSKVIRRKKKNYPAQYPRKHYFALICLFTFFAEISKNSKNICGKVFEIPISWNSDRQSQVHSEGPEVRTRASICTCTRRILLVLIILFFSFLVLGFVLVLVFLFAYATHCEVLVQKGTKGSTELLLWGIIRYVITCYCISTFFCTWIWTCSCISIYAAERHKRQHGAIVVLGIIRNVISPFLSFFYYVGQR